MNNLTFLGQIGLFVVYVLGQVFFAKELELFGVAYCFVYINYILTLSLGINRTSLLLISFLLGLVVDSFYDTLGIHTAACVLIAYLRPMLIETMTAKAEVNELSIRNTSFTWFLSYSFSLVFLHHLSLFLIQQFNFNQFFFTLLKSLASTGLTLFFIVIIQYLFYPPNVGHAR